MGKQIEEYLVRLLFIIITIINRIKVQAVASIVLPVIAVFMKQNT